MKEIIEPVFFMLLGFFSGLLWIFISTRKIDNKINNLIKRSEELNEKLIKEKK